jgi:hypothetical protein
LQKAHVSDRIDEICKSKEMINQLNFSNRYREARGMGLGCRNLIVGSGINGKATELTTILIQEECSAQRI